MTGNNVEIPGQVKVPFQAPTSNELYAFFSQFLDRWANLKGEYITWSSETLIPMGLEEGVLFSEPTPGLLVLRASENLEGYLPKASKVKPMGVNPVKSEIFLEMTVLFWHLFVKRYFQLDSRKMTPVVLRSSLPMDWPNHEPQTAALVMIKDSPMEIRLWLGLAPEDIARFRHTKT